jgi:SAM-dependent methyltransferase
MIKVITNYPVAINSNDHLYPLGAKNDNHTSVPFIEEVENYCGAGKKLNVADLGCAGGQLIVDFYKRGHLAVGLEGSDYCKNAQKYNWNQNYTDTVLFTCDITKEWKVTDNDTEIKFDCITAWEVLEHIKREDQHNTLKYIYDNLKDDGMLIASVSTVSNPHPDKLHIELHETLFDGGFWVSREIWIREILGEFFIILDYPFYLGTDPETYYGGKAVRMDVVRARNSFLFMGKKKL